MTKRPLFGNLPADPNATELGVRRAPIPLVTQPMATANVDPEIMRTLAEGAAAAQANLAQQLASAAHGAAPPPHAGQPARTRPPTAPPGGAQTISPAHGFVAPAAPPGQTVAPPVVHQTAPPPMASRQVSSQGLGAMPGTTVEIGLTQHHLPSQGHDPRLVLVADPDSERAAAFRVLRYHLLDTGRPQVIVVSSPNEGDGKTITAVNLALALAECGRARVLLVEAAVRKPALAQILRLTPPWCFAEQLAAHRHQPTLPWSLVDIPQLWLHVAAMNPAIQHKQMLDAPAFSIAIERLRLGGYDHIIIDGPSVLGSADVNLIQDAADGVLLTLRAGLTTARDLRKSIEQLSPGKVLGTALLH